MSEMFFDVGRHEEEAECRFCKKRRACVRASCKKQTFANAPVCGKCLFSQAEVRTEPEPPQSLPMERCQG